MLIEREYDVIPPAPHAYSGFGALPNEAEDLLLLFRLFRPGDLAFVSLSMQKPDSQPSIQYPYRVISNLVSGSPRGRSSSTSPMSPCGNRSPLPQAFAVVELPVVQGRAALVCVWWGERV